MLTLPDEYFTLSSAFVPLFSKRIWQPAQVLLIGAILVLGKRTVTSALRVMGLSDEKHFQNYQRKPRQKGRGRKKGARLPILEHVLRDKTAAWQRVTIRNWYGEARRTLEIVSGTAVWYHGGMTPVPIRWVLIRDPKGEFKAQALLCTDLHVNSIQMIEWFVLRWQLEVTFEEVRAHLGVETQRQWSDWAIARTTPGLLGLFSLVTLLAHRSRQRGKLPVRQAAWYTKRLPTFSDALAVVRSQLWHAMSFHTSLTKTNTVKVPSFILKRYTDALCYAG